MPARNKFRVGDCLVTIGYGSGILARAIQTYQRYLLGHEPEEAWRSTHVEVIVEIADSKIKTFSQTFPLAIWVERDKHSLAISLMESRPRYALFRFHDYSNVVTHKFEKGMMEYFKKEVGKGYNRWRDILNGLYDVGGLVMYPINWAARLFGYKKHIAWFEAPRANVCSDGARSGYEHGYRADGKDPHTQFPGIPASEIAPSHFWQPASKMFRTGLV